MGSTLHPTPQSAPLAAEEGGALGAPGALLPSTFVVPLDGSDYSRRAVPVALRYAASVGADLVAMTTPSTLDGPERMAVPEWLNDVVHEAGGARITATVIDDDDPARAIAATVTATPGAYVCMATHARGPIGSAALGNVAQQVLRVVTVPVVLVGRHCTPELSEHGPIVVCHDGSVAADAVLAPVRAWARKVGLPVVLLHVYHPLDVETAQHPRDAIRPALDFLGPGTLAEVVAGSFTAGTIRDVAHELDASMVAISTHGRTGAARVVMGSVAAWVTRESPCPVLTVRPRGLET